MISVTNKISGEVLDFAATTPDEIVSAWRQAQEFEKLAKEIKAKLGGSVDKLLTEKGVSENYGGYMFRSSAVQRYKYDKSKVREYFEDADLIDTFLVVDKKALDTYVKENIASLNGFSRDDFLVPDGKPYSVTKLEKLK